MREEHETVGRLTVLLAGLLVALALLHHWQDDAVGLAGQWLRAHHFLFVTAVLVSAAALSQLALWWPARRFARSPDPASETGFWQKVTASVPLVTAGFVAHQLNFIPILSGARITLGGSPPDAGVAPAVSFAALSVAQGFVLSAGLLVSAIVLWRLSRPSRSS